MLHAQRLAGDQVDQPAVKRLGERQRIIRRGPNASQHVGAAHRSNDRRPARGPSRQRRIHGRGDDRHPSGVLRPGRSRDHLGADVAAGNRMSGQRDHVAYPDRARGEQLATARFGHRFRDGQCGDYDCGGVERSAGRVDKQPGTPRAGWQPAPLVDHQAIERGSGRVATSRPTVPRPGNDLRPGPAEL